MFHCELPSLDRVLVSTWLSLLLILALPASGRSMDELSFSDLKGKQFSLKASAGQRALVLIFVTTDCPIANSYQPTLAKLYSEFRKQGFEFLLVHEGPNQSLDKLKKHSHEYSVPFSVAMDPDHSIARRVGAKITPEAFVLSRDGIILYQGRIDDLHPRFGKKRSSVSRADLRLALLEIESGVSVSISKTDAVGCSIPLK